MKPQISVIIVHFQAQRELFTCLHSLKQSKPKLNYEVIVVDNDKRQPLSSIIKKKFPRLVYLPVSDNLGFAKACNLGADKARGEYLFFLNPDTIVSQNCLNSLYKKLKSKAGLGMIAPQLLDAKGRVIVSQCSEELTPLRLIFSHSVLHRLFPHNPIAGRFWHSDWDRRRPRQVGFLEGSAFLIRRRVFFQVGGFDERFFMYFEDVDWCRRFWENGYRVVYNPTVTVAHYHGRASGNKSAIQAVLLNKLY
jgi:GT2 family glycosyltransferase